MSEHVFSAVRVARTIDGWQVWIEGSALALAVTRTEREARSVASRLRSIGARLDWGNRIRSMASA